MKEAAGEDLLQVRRFRILARHVSEQGEAKVGEIDVTSLRELHDLLGELVRHLLLRLAEVVDQKPQVRLIVGEMLGTPREGVSQHLEHDVIV